MIGFVAKFPLHNARNFAQVDRGIELLHVEHRARHGLGIDGLLRPSGLCTPVAEAGHAFENKAPGFVAHHSPLHPGVTTAFSRRFGEEDNRPDDLVIMLDRIDKLPPKLLAFFLSSHLNFAQK